MADVIPLTPQLREKVYEYGGLGRRAWEAGDVASAERHFLEAWSCIPEPRLQHDFAASMAVALTEFYRDTGQSEPAARWLALARAAYGPEPDPHTEFLAATVFYEVGDMDEAYVLFDGLYKTYKRRPFEGAKPDYLSYYLERSGAGKR
jgi:hypothetical protein